MTQTWTTQQILALAPDPASGKAGQSLAGPRKWVSLGRSERAVWGECQGSGANPYQVQIDLDEPAFRCSCPSRKFPCKHGIGLFLIFANDLPAIPEAAPPAWVVEWLAKRSEKAEKQETKKAEGEKSEAELAKAAEEQAKRAAQRQQKVTRGLQDLDLWLRDLLRQGFAAVQSKPYRFWDEMAGRMVDAQAPGVAGRLRSMASIPNSGEGWQERLLEEIGRLALLLEAYSRLDTLPETFQADVRDAIGWNVRQETVLAGDGVRDLWSVLGQHSYEEEQYRVHRTWLHGKQTGSDALLLQFLRPNQPQEAWLVPGTCFEAELNFFPGACPLRALIKERLSVPLPLTDFPGYPGAAALLSGYADALARNPWIDAFPAPLAEVLPLRQGEGWALRDRAGALLSLTIPVLQGWRLLALSGGHPVSVFGEWDGLRLRPLSAWAGEQLIALA